MKNFAVTICVSTIACSVLSLLCSDLRLKKVVSLVMGAFIVCSVLFPLLSISSISLDDFSPHQDIESFDENTDEAYKKAVLNETAKNLVKAADDLLRQEGIEVENIDLAIKLSENDSIYISRIYIYISENDSKHEEKIKSIIKNNMNKEPVIVAYE